MRHADAETFGKRNSFLTIFKILLLVSLILPLSAQSTLALSGLTHTDQDLLAPSLSGPNGGFRAISAQRAWYGDFSAQFGFHSEYFIIDSLFPTSADTNRLLIDVSTSFAINEYIEFFGLWQAMSNNKQTGAQLLQQFGNFQLGAKAGFEPVDWFSMAALFRGEYLNSVGDLGQTDEAWNLVPMALFTFDLTRLESPLPLRFHANAGYRFDKSWKLQETVAFNAEQRFLLRTYLDDHALFAVGTEIVADFINFLVEYSTEQSFTTGFGGYLAHPQRITFGIRLFPFEKQDISFDFAADARVFGQTSTQMFLAEPDYNAIFGITFSRIPGTEEEPKQVVPETGRIAGIVVDDATGKAVGGALITFPEMELTRLQSHPDKGTFVLGGITPGNLEAEVNADGYEASKATFSVTAGQTVNPEVRLKKDTVKAKGILVLRVTDTDNKPIPAVLKFPRRAGAKILNVPAKGMKARLNAEKYEILVEAQGFESETHMVEIKPNAEVILLVKLRETSAKVEFKDNKISIADKIFFALGKATLLPASLRVLNRVADLIADNPQITKIRIEGHTDSTGKESYNLFLSQKRAESVVDYLVSRGIERTRLEAVGYGPSRPIADNATKEGREKNRRVEFTVVRTTQQ